MYSTLKIPKSVKASAYLLADTLWKSSKVSQGPLGPTKQTPLINQGLAEGGPGNPWAVLSRPPS